MGVLILLGLAGGAYWIIVFGGAYWDNHEVRAVLGQAGNMCYREPSDEAIRTFVVLRLHEMFGHETEEFGRRKMVYAVDFDPTNDLTIARSKVPQMVTIDLSYSRTIKMPIVGGERTLYFSDHIEQDLSPVKW